MDVNENDFQYSRCMRRRMTAAPIAMALLIAGCGGDDEGERQSGSGGAVELVATTTHVADLARNVGGKRVDVTGLLALNADPHDHEIRPGDVEALSGADLVLRSGGDLDAWLSEAIAGSGTEAPVLNVIEHVRTIQGGHEDHAEEEAHPEEDVHSGGEVGADGHSAEEAGGGEAAHVEEADAVDPHWWQDPRNAQRAVTAMRDALAAADPAGRDSYRRNAAAYLEDLRRLDESVEKCMARVPEDRRKLVSTHDSLGYYAQRYDIEVIGTVIPSLSTQGQPSAGETRDLVETIEREKVKAIFTETSVNPKVERAIAEEAGATIGEPLWADTLGPDGSAGDTYLKSIAANTRAFAGGFTGGTLKCRLPF